MKVLNPVNFADDIMPSHGLVEGDSLEPLLRFTSLYKVLLSRPNCFEIALIDFPLRKRIEI